MSKYAASDISGPCFNFDKVISASLAVVNTVADSSTPLCFCDSLPFTIKIPLISTLGSGCDGSNPCWASSQFIGAHEPEGPYLTELTGTTNAGTLIVAEASGAKAVYSFERYTPSSTDAYPVPENTPIILLRVFQPGGGLGYVQVQAGALDDVASSTFHQTVVVPKTQAIANKVMWGVIGRDKTNNCMLMYADATVATKGALPLVQAFNWGNHVYKSRGLAATGSNGVHSSFHGVTTTPKAVGIYEHTVFYTDDGMTLVPGNLPEFDPKQIDSGAANVQWIITALPLTALTARIYGDRYCAAYCDGKYAHYTGPPVCKYIESAFPSVLDTASRKCQSQVNLEQQEHMEKVLTILSACGLGLELAVCVVIVVSLLKMKKE